LHSAAKAKAAEFQNVVALGATAFAPGKADRWPGWEDSAVPPDSIEDYLRALKKLFARHDYNASVYGHFGQGLVHCRLPFEFNTPVEKSSMRFSMTPPISL
jgi:FAD/FMN-containing dehydrogenase